MCSQRTAMLLIVGFLAAPTGVQAAQTDQGVNRLERLVYRELVTLPYFGVFDNLSFKVEGRKVTLMGQVTRPTLKSSAENVVRQIEGVEQVDNQIEVLPLSPNDDRLRLELYRAIYGHTALNQYALRAIPTIHIIVKNGNVTADLCTALTGVLCRSAKHPVW